MESDELNYGIHDIGSAVIGRGYSLVWDREERRLIRDAADVEVGDGLKIRLHRGSLEATVTTKETP